MMKACCVVLLLMTWQLPVVFPNNNTFKLEAPDCIAQCFQTSFLIKHIRFNFCLENPAMTFLYFFRTKSRYCSLEAGHGTVLFGVLLSLTSGDNAGCVSSALISKDVDSYMGGIRFPQRRIFWNVISKNKTPRRPLIWPERLLLIGPRRRLPLTPLQCLKLRCGLIWRAGVITAC